ncbi:hypothetical protein ACFYSF_22350 [Streptomyces canus]|uniref:hypothetical protein n=1 Tax=Streptomyces canus TaxID=58343 RepID=UPI0036C81AA8
MPVEPVPCAPGDGGTPGTCACAPSIAATPLCRADGTTVLLVIRSECADCGSPAADPAVIGWIDPATGTYTPGAAPADAGPCTLGCSCSPSISTTPMCRADGTTVLVVVRSDCADCDTPAPDPAVVGWIDPLTGVFTPGPAPADVGPCTTGCIDTVCRQRCDDTTGDGIADATYSELWCIRADGTADLVLTYQDDPSTPYVPVSPVDCTYGCPDHETVMLCDDSGPFLRRYVFLDGTASYEDVALDGQTPHVVTGTVGACAGDAGSGATPCAEQTTPAATLGLCLADGTPIAVVVTRDCATDTVTQDGWINLTTGTYSTGAPPAGAQACGDSRSIQISGTFCDVDTDGEVVGLVLIEYSYAADGTIDTVRLVDATTGLTYVPTGTVTVCPAGAAQPATDLDLTVLCDVQADGTAVTFLRDYRRDPTTGQINGHTDYGLDGTPYTPTGTVAQCSPPCQNSTTLLLCDLPDDVDPTGEPVATDTAQQFIADIPNGDFIARPGGGATLWAGGAITFGPDVSTNPGVITQVHRYVAATLQADAPACTAGTAHLSLSVEVENMGPGVGCSGAGRFRLFHTDGTVLAAGTGLIGTPVGVPQTLTVEADVPAADLAAGDVAIWLDVETFQTATCPPPDGKTWEARNFSATYAYDTAGCGEQFLRTLATDCETGAVLAVSDTTLDGQPYTVTGTVGQCSVSGSGGSVTPGTDVEVVALCDTDGVGAVTAFLRHIAYDSAGVVASVTDTALDGVTPYAPTGTVGVCTAAAEDCRDTNALLLCDLPTDGAPAPTLTDTPGAPYYPYTTGVPAAGAQALWDGGTLTLPDEAGPQPGTGGTVRTAAAILQAPRPVCDAGTAHLTVQVDATQLGPDNGCRNTGFLGLYNGTGEANRVALALAPLDTPAGWSGTLTVEADVPAADLVAGNIAVLIAVDTYDDSGATCPPPRRTGWQLDQFAATVVYDQTGCATQFLRNVTVDCETGAVVSVTDTTLDGVPYTVTGEPGQCATASGGECCPEQPCGDTEVAQLCDLTYDPQAPLPTPAGDFTLTGNVVAANDGTTLWFAQANQPADGVAELTVGGLLPAVLYEFRFASAWIGAGAPDPANNNAIYQLEILDGATVLATRTRNTSNGSNVFPGGVLTEDLPPLAFIAPATGAVTIRFTDQTTGGPVNDRDLYLMPIEVRTAVLTVTRTPFLRRLTFDCDGVLTSTQDLGLDGVTPYVVQGDVGACSADGGTAGAVTPCDVQNVIEACRCDDADGDGIPETGYVELLAVDCTGALSSVGTYLPDYSAPYTPVSPMDCDAGEDLGAPPAFGVQAHRVELAAGASWSADAWPTLQSVTAVAHGGAGTVTTADGTSTLHPTETATWGVSRDTEARLTGPLTITAGPGTVTITFTTGVQL